MSIPTIKQPLTEEQVREAFRAGMLYSAKKYSEVAEDRFTGNDVSMFLEMEAAELLDEEIDKAVAATRRNI